MLSQIFKNVYMRLDEKAVTMAQPQKMWSGILVPCMPPCLILFFCYSDSAIPRYIWNGRTSSVDSRTQFCDKSNSLELVPE